jgi:iron(II)-dependent oxidoreductase
LDNRIHDAAKYNELYAMTGTCGQRHQFDSLKREQKSPESATSQGNRAMMTGAQLADWVRDARERTFAIVSDLSDSQLIGPQLAILNPLLWEIGHVAWFQEKWMLRREAGKGSLRPNGDALYDSAAVHHDTRWDLRLPSRQETLRYLTDVRDRVMERLTKGEPSRDDVYFTLLSVFHEDMHNEAFFYTRQTLGYPAPKQNAGAQHSESAGRATGPLPGDVHIPDGDFRLGSEPNEPFVFDNEKWAHQVPVKSFAIARAPVTQAEFAAFAEDDGYRQSRYWSEEGWQWRTQSDARHPVYWQRQSSGRWLRRNFDQWVPLEPDRPVLHVNWYEADAYCRWARRRLPTELEWEVAAAAEPDGSGHGIAGSKRRFPWGAESPSPRHANLDAETLGSVDVAACADGDGAFGCRQMIGNVWEWTASDFLPYPGFSADPYKEYSAPWFGDHKVLRGGCWATRARLLRNTWRNFYRPDRRDVWAGFRTCALQP